MATGFATLVVAVTALRTKPTSVLSNRGALQESDSIIDQADGLLRSTTTHDPSVIHVACEFQGMMAEDHFDVSKSFLYGLCRRQNDRAPGELAAQMDHLDDAPDDTYYNLLGDVRQLGRLTPGETLHVDLKHIDIQPDKEMVAGWQSNRNAWVISKVTKRELRIEATARHVKAQTVQRGSNRTLIAVSTPLACHRPAPILQGACQ